MQQKDYRLAAIMYTDIQGFSRMMEKDEKGTLELLDYHNDLVNTLAMRYNGRVIKTIGDALLVVFPTTPDAVNCALDIQNTLADYNKLSGKLPLRLRIGVHLGDIYFYENDALGEGINIASRLQSIAFPGCICVSREVYTNVFNKIHADFRKLGRVNLKNITKEIDAYEIVTANAVDYTRATPAMPDRHETAETAAGAAGAPSAQGGTSPASEVAQKPPAAAQMGDFEELKRYVIEQIKNVGRRISVERVRATFPHHGPGFEAALQKLADMGFLTREGPAAESRAAADSSNTGGYETGPRPAPQPEPPRPAAGPWEWARNWETYSRNIDVWKAQAHAMRHAYRSQRHAARHAAKDAAHAGVAEMMDESHPFGYAEYRERVIEHAPKARAGFIAHFFPFLAVNGFLFFIWASTGAGFPWYLFPLGGWAVGLLSHLAAARTRQKERAEVEALPQNLGTEDYKLLRKFHKARAGARSAATSLLAVSGLLVMINLVTSAGYLWCLYPIGGMMIGLVSAVSSYLVRRGGFLKRIRNLIKNKSAVEAERVASGEEEDSPLVKQAISLASSILAQARELGKDKAFGGEDLKPLLDNYISQLRMLTRKSSEVQAIIDTIPHQELDRDLAELHRRYEAATSESLKREYQRSIEQIEHHNKSYEDLKNQKELMDLKINNSFNSLTQMQLDLARMAGLTTAMAPSSLDTFKRKTQELSSYLDDVASSYQELEGTPRLGEKERAEADKLLAEFKKKTLESDQEAN